MTMESLKNADLSLFNEGDIFQIKPTFTPPDLDDPSFDLFLVSLEQFIEKILPPSILDNLVNYPSEKTIEKSFRQLNETLPVLKYSFSEKMPFALSVGLLCHSEYTNGVGRYMNDMLSRWLIPGKQLPIVANRSMDFYFLRCQKYRYYLLEAFVRLADEKEMTLVQKNISNLLKEIRINTLAVYHARYIVSVKSLSFEEKNAVIQENISSLMKTPTGFVDQNVFDQMQYLLIKISSEEKIQDIEKNVSYLMHKRPKFFDKDVFYEIRHFLLQLKDQFIFKRDARHISRIIGFQYLLKKTTLRQAKKYPNERHLSLKLLKTRQDKRYCLGILISINLLNDTERFEKKHVLKSIRSIGLDIQYVKDSYFSDRSDERIRSLYFEIEKTNASKFTFEEIKKLRKRLPKEVKSRVENVIHPIFLPRNEEEIIRNIIILSKQLKYVRDLPQVIITYNNQTDSQISFMVILVRLLKTKTKSIKELFVEKKSSINFSQDENKIVGYLKRKYPKEANIFRVFVDKSPFFRSDYSLDLQKARQRVVSELISIIGEFRDYNGGMILKQHEILNDLRNCLAKLEIEDDFLLENFFYSLKPGIMQGILSPQMLKFSFLQLLDAVDHDYEQQSVFVKNSSEGNYLFITVASENGSFKNILKNHLSQLNISSLELISSSLKIYDIHTMAYIFKSHDKYQKDLFVRTVNNALKFWDKNYSNSTNSQ